MPEIFQSITAGTLTLAGYFICFGVAILCGIIIAAASSFRSSVSKGFIASLILLPAIVDTVIMLVNGNLGTAVAVMGVFALVRFRSVASKAKDIVSVFLAMSAGLACAGGYVAVAIVFTVIICVGLIIVELIPMRTDRELLLKITVPESLDSAGAFDGIFEKYTLRHRLVKMKTSDMGSLYKLTYKIELKNNDDMKAFIDELRTRNGNLEISVGEGGERTDTL